MRLLARPSYSFSSSSRCFFSSSDSLKFEVLGDVDELLALELLELGEGVLVDGVGEEEDLEVLGLERASRKGDFSYGLECSRR